MNTKKFILFMIMFNITVGLMNSIWLTNTFDKSTFDTAVISSENEFANSAKSDMDDNDYGFGS